MKKIVRSFALASVCLCFVAQFNLFAQHYSLTTPIGGNIPLRVQQQVGFQTFSASGNLDFYSLSADVYVNAVNQTVRQVGSIFYTPTVSSITLAETQNVPGAVTLYFQPGALNFDVTSTFGNSGLLFQMGPIQGTYSLDTGGQTYLGQFSFSLQDAFPNGPFRLYRLDDFVSDQNSILLHSQNPNSDEAYWTPNPIIDLTAPNGFHASISVGNLAHNDTFYQDIFLYLPYEVTASIVPEPSSLSIVGCMLGFSLLRSRKRIPSSETRNHP